ncbi:TrkH family potassium uptake protein [Limibacillus halophilus]|uniref:Trk system potassium uptake protein n=1 Tax=Limibacillus halophilus TaxID=1579333 RepID=A0A839SZG1_9PROT|nr:TrkH family potassium uptake protein [Limibacillus halophilus]MBB3066303.1 trk system potassium uptake protein TrkH [Limibacillus halophilus]
MDLRPVCFVLGILLSILAVAMTLPAIVDYAFGHRDWEVFLAAAAVTLFVGVALILSTRSGWHGFSLRQAFVMTASAWVVIAFFGALPLAFSELKLDMTDAFFESMSGITTTGSTVIVGLDNAPPGILLWRAILQWLGGIGIIVMALAILPILQVGGMQIFRVEAFETSEKVLPRAAQMAGEISIVYVGLTFVTAVLLWTAGMSGFDALAHAMTAIATGGFSTRDASLGAFNVPAIHWIVIVTMILGSVPFVLYLRVLRGDARSLFRDGQVRWMIAILFGASMITLLWLLSEGFYSSSHDAARHAVFNVVSVMTGTGYSSTDFGMWGGFPSTLLFVLMFIGGCAGSTTCGIKIFRFQVIYAEAHAQLRKLIQPNGIFIPYYAGKPIPEGVAQSVMGFFFLYGAAFATLALGLGFMGLDFTTAVSGAATAISNVGPGLGEIIGASGSFATLPDGAKWLLSVGMLLGRLELFTILVLFLPAFWRA